MPHVFAGAFGAVGCGEAGFTAKGRSASFRGRTDGAIGTVFSLTPSLSPSRGPLAKGSETPFAKGDMRGVSSVFENGWGSGFFVVTTIGGVAATASATTTVLTGAGEYAGYLCTVAAGNITVYDNTAASGRVIVPLTALVVGAFPICLLYTSDAADE